MACSMVYSKSLITNVVKTFPIVYQPCCLVPCCQGKLGRVNLQKQLTKPTVQFILSLSTLSITLVGRYQNVLRESAPKTQIWDPLLILSLRNLLLAAFYFPLQKVASFPHPISCCCDTGMQLFSPKGNSSHMTSAKYHTF